MNFRGFKYLISFAIILILTLYPITFSLRDSKAYNFLGHVYFPHKIWSVLWFSILLYSTYKIRTTKNFILYLSDKIFNLFNKLPEKSYLTTLSIIFIAITIFLSWKFFNFLPHIQDSIAQYLHAKILASGNFYLPLPEYKDSIKLENFIYDEQQNKFYSQYPPGHILLLTLGEMLKMQWMVNPFLGALTLIYTYFLAKELFSEKVAKISGILFLLSPFILVMSSEYMNHSSSLLFTTMFAYYFFKSIRLKKTSSFILMGFSLGFLLITRPYTAFLVSIPFSLYGTYLLLTKKIELKKFIYSFSIFSIFVGFQLFYNYETTGEPLLYGYIKLHGENHMPKFGDIPKSFETTGHKTIHSVEKGIKNVTEDVIGLNHYLFDWSIPSLFFAILALVIFCKNMKVIMLFSIFLSLLIGHIFYFFNVWIFGPRFLYEASSALVILAALCFSEEFIDKLEEIFTIKINKKHFASFSLFLIISLFVTTYFKNVNYKYNQYASVNFWGINNKIKEKIDNKVPADSLIFVKSKLQSFATSIPLFGNEKISYVSYMEDDNPKVISAIKPKHIFIENKMKLYKYDENVSK